MAIESVALWLLATDPAEFSFAQLQEKHRVVWDGVTNPLARNHLRQIKLGERLFIYHAGAENKIVGTAVCAKSCYSDPHSKDPREIVIEIEAERALDKPLSLDEIKQVPELADWELVRQPRLSVVAVPGKIRKALTSLLTKGVDD